jgi:hypothetical protein
MVLDSPLLPIHYFFRFSKMPAPLQGNKFIRNRHVLSCFFAKPYSFRSSNSNPQDFIPHLRYTPKGGRTATAVHVRNRRDTWLATMLENVRNTLQMGTGPSKSVAKMLLEDDQEGLTKRQYSALTPSILKCKLTVNSRYQNYSWWIDVRRF